MTYANATALTVKKIPQAGRDISTLQSPDGTNGNKFAANPQTLLRVKNTGTQKALTIETPGTVIGLAIADAPFVIPATTGDVLVPMLPEYFQPGTQEVFISFDTVTGVTVDVYQP